MSREVCGICWTPYDDSYKCACPTPALDVMKCPRCGKVTRPDDVHTCTPKALRLADALSSNGEGCECHASSYYECGCDDAIWPEMYVLQAAAELRRLHEENERLHQINQSHEMKLSVRGYEIQIEDLKVVNAELLEALKLAQSIIGHPDDAHSRHIAAVIAKAEAA
jgi:hypothetical protein